MTSGLHLVRLALVLGVAAALAFAAAGASASTRGVGYRYTLAAFSAGGSIVVDQNGDHVEGRLELHGTGGGTESGSESASGPVQGTWTVSYRGGGDFPVSCSETVPVSGNVVLDWSVEAPRPRWGLDREWPSACNVTADEIMAWATFMLDLPGNDPDPATIRAGKSFAVSYQGSDSDEGLSRSFSWSASLTGSGSDPCALRVSWANGDVGIESGGESASLTGGEALTAGDTIVTGADGRAEARLPDGSVIRLGRSGRLAIRGDECRPRGSRFSLKLFLGKVWSNVIDVVAPRPPFEVETTNAVIGVRGTVFEVSYDPGRRRTLAHAIQHTIFVRAAGRTLNVPQGRCAEAVGRTAPRLVRCS